MLNTKVLVAYASKYGATEEIAQRVGEVLRNEGLDTDVLSAEEVSDLAPYGAVVLGSAVYAGQWRKEAASFLEENVEALAERPVWIFSSGPTGEGDPAELLKGWRIPEGLQAATERIQPRELAIFGGEMDMKRLNLAEKMIIKAMKAPTGDFRDWDEIEGWARQIAEALQGE